MKLKEEKPKIKLINEDSNIFNLMGIASKALKNANQHDKAKEMVGKIFSCDNYSKALGIIGEYCEIT